MSTEERSFTVRIVSNVTSDKLMDAILEALKKFETDSVEVEDDETGTCYFTHEAAPNMGNKAGTCQSCSRYTDDLDDHDHCPDCSE